jgi:hypothetical protein
MKWFKHISDSLHDPFIFQLMSEFGAEGYLVFFGTLEIYAREFKAESDWKLTEKLSYFRHNLLISSSKFKKILSKITKWEVSFNGDEVTIFIPKFRELLDDWTIRKVGKAEEKLRSNPVVTPKKLRAELEVEVDTDKEKEKKRHKPDKPAFILPEDIDKEIWKAFEEMRKKIKAPLTDKARSLIVSELNKIGQDKNKVLEQSIEKAWRGVFPLREQPAIMSDHPGDEAAKKLWEIYGKNKSSPLA